MRRIVQTCPGIPGLLRGEPGTLRRWTEDWRPGHLGVCVLLIALGAGSFGLAMGVWRAPLQAVYCALKLPLILVLTALGNGLLNSMWAPLLGLNMPARQTLLAVLMSFVVAAIILGACSPLLGFLVWNLPPLAARSEGRLAAHSVILVTETAMIAFAGIAANLRLAQLLRSCSRTPVNARNVLIAWLSGNLLLGSQLAWLARPFVGSPGLPVEFLRADAFRGSFFEALWSATRHLLRP